MLGECDRLDASSFECGDTSNLMEKHGIFLFSTYLELPKTIQ